MFNSKFYEMHFVKFSPGLSGERSVRVMKDLLRKNKVGKINTRLSSVLLYLYIAFVN